MVIFGATGDLTHRKLVPALYNIAAEGELTSDLGIKASKCRNHVIIPCVGCFQKVIGATILILHIVAKIAGYFRVAPVTRGGG